MKLIADSGSTKTDWALADPQSSSVAFRKFTTQGLNPFHQSGDTITSVLRSELLPQLDVSSVSGVSFYGSGVRPELETVMADILRGVFPLVEDIEVHSDMLGAARAVCCRDAGIACILGTGANSCLYDGNAIVANTPAMGYILGDEGSGASLGKRLVHDLYKGVLSEEIRDAFECETGLGLADIIDKVYRQPLPNRFLASFSAFIGRHKEQWPVLSEMVADCFTDFFRFNILPYDRPDLPVSFVGSIAYYYASELRLAASRLQLGIGTILRSPIEGLVRYHQMPSPS